VAAFIIYSGWGLLWDGMKVLLDASLDQETLTQVRRIVESDPAVIDVRTLEGRNSGRYRFLELVIAVRAENLEKAHAISTRVEKRVRAEVARIDRVIIHCEPQARTRLRVAVPLADIQGTVSSHFGESPFFASLVVSVDSGELQEQQIKANPIGQVEKARGILAAEWLIRDKVDLVIQKEQLGKGPEYAFRDAGVEVEVWNVATLTDVVERLRANVSRFASG
jgi:predicted Fe-Mo cluster-binding NifX family protein